MSIKKSIGLVVLGGVIGYSTKSIVDGIRNRVKNVDTDVEVIDFIFGDSEGAYKVVTAMIEIGEKYGIVYLADYYDLVGHLPDISANGVGWDLKTIKKAKVVESGKDYAIELPKLKAL